MHMFFFSLSSLYSVQLYEWTMTLNYFWIFWYHQGIFLLLSLSWPFYNELYWIQWIFIEYNIYFIKYTHSKHIVWWVLVIHTVMKRWWQSKFRVLVSYLKRSFMPLCSPSLLPPSSEQLLICFLLLEILLFEKAHVNRIMLHNYCFFFLAFFI